MAKSPLLVVLTLIFSFHSYAQAEIQNAELNTLHERIDTFIENSKQFSNDELARQELELSRLEIQMALIDYRHILKELSSSIDRETLARSMHSYNLAVVKSYLPRYEPPHRKLYQKIIQHADPVAIEPIISRAEAANLFLTEIPSQNELSTEIRVAEVIHLHNSIVKRINTYRETELYAKYDVRDIVRNIASESDISRLIISGETSQETTPQRWMTNHSNIIEVDTDHFRLAQTCAGLFGN